MLFCCWGPSSDKISHGILLLKNYQCIQERAVGSTNKIKKQLHTENTQYYDNLSHLMVYKNKSHCQY